MKTDPGHISTVLFGCLFVKPVLTSGEKWDRSRGNTARNHVNKKLRSRPSHQFKTHKQSSQPLLCLWVSPNLNSKERQTPRRAFFYPVVLVITFISTFTKNNTGFGCLVSPNHSQRLAGRLQAAVHKSQLKNRSLFMLCSIVLKMEKLPHYVKKKGDKFPHWNASPGKKSPRN